ncbi:hypothetical protein L7F22_051965 [Adiantum nelumboides]|nr:hypothetical protein [Adiantum nelumboides]
MKDLGELRYFLGIEKIHNEGGVWLSQKKYGLNMLMKYGMTDCKPISTPLDQNLNLRIDEEEVLDDATLYRRIVGSLIYMTISRPDLSYVVGLVHRYRYMATQILIGLVVFLIADLPVAICFLLGVLLSHGVARSSPQCTEVEYKGATIAAREVAWLKMLLQDLEI